MISEILVSFSEQIKKSRNPFFGTFILVWVVRNWKLIVTLFNIDLYPALDQKIEILQTYFVDSSIIVGFLNVSWISLLAIIASYFLLNVSRFVANIFENRVTPFVYKITSPKEIVLKSDYDKIQNAVTKLEQKLITERERRVEAENQRDELENAQRKIPKEDVDNLESNVTENNSSNDDVELVIGALDKRELTKTFNDLVPLIKSKKLIHNETATPFIKMDLLKFKRSVTYNRDISEYELTELGELVWKRLIKINLID